MHDGRIAPNADLRDKYWRSICCMQAAMYFRNPSQGLKRRLQALKRFDRATGRDPNYDY